MSDPKSRSEVLSGAANPRRLRLAREARGWTQAELSSRVSPSVSSAAISQLENGKSRPTPATLRALSDAMDFPIEFFLHRNTDEDTPGFFRRLQSVPARTQRQALARAQMLHDLARAVERHVRLPEVDVPRNTEGGREPEDIVRIADRVRRSWGLLPGPVPNVVRELERHGIVVARFALDQADIDGFSVWYPDRPVAVLGDDKGVCARSRFDAAHELGHLAMHGPERAGTRAAENEAHQFAAAFLMPEDDIYDDLPSKADWRQLVDLKAEWGVSVGALLKRAKDLGVMSDHTYVNAMKAMSAKGWRKKEPGDHLLGQPEQPALLGRAIKIARKELDLGLPDLAQAAGLPLWQVEELTQLSLDRRPGVSL